MSRCLDNPASPREGRRVRAVQLRGLLVAGWLTGAVAIQASDTDYREAEAPPAPVAPAVASNVPPEINEALRNSREGLATTNLLDPEDVEKVAKLVELRERLDAARRLKTQRNFRDAASLLAGILNENAPEDLHRTALLEMALAIEDEGRHVRAQQVFSQYIAKYPEDPSVPEVLLRQGLLYRKMGAVNLSLTKFYAVMSSALRLTSDQMGYYQRLVLQAQTEIAETYYLQGNHDDAVEFLNRLLRLDNPELNKSQIHYKLIRSLAALGQSESVLLQSEMFLSQYSEAPEVADVRYLLARALRELGRNTEAKQQMLVLLESQHVRADADPADWIYWQHRAGNEVANLLYLEGDFVNALEIYRTLAGLSDSRDWQVPVWYQMGLIYERLEQPQQASDLYQRILDRPASAEASSEKPAVQAVLDMARWRLDFLNWQAQTGRVTDRLSAPPVAPNLVATPAS